LVNQSTITQLSGEKPSLRMVVENKAGGPEPSDGTG